MPKDPEKAAYQARTRALGLEKLELEVKKAREGLDQERIKTEAEQLKLDDLRATHEERTSSNRANQIYLFDTEVDIETARECIETLLAWNRVPEVTQIDLLLRTPGGDPDSGSAIMDAAYLLDNVTLDTFILGNASSMGPILAQVGDTRWMGRHSTMLIHQGSLEFNVDFSIMKDQIRGMELFHEAALDALAARATISRDEIKDRWERRDWYLGAEEAKELGFVDEIF